MNLFLDESRLVALGVAEDGAAYTADGPPVDPPFEADGSSADIAQRGASMQALRVAAALVEGAARRKGDRQERRARFSDAVARSLGSPPPIDDDAAIAPRLRQLSRGACRHLAEQLQLLVRFDKAELFKRDGCRSMIVWMDSHLGIAGVAASERLRVGRALQTLPVLSALLASGKLTWSKLREITRHATADNELEFASATLELSASETADYCRRFRHRSDKEDDAANAALDGQDAADSQAALRAHDRRELNVRDIDEYSTRITLTLPRDLAAEYLSSLEQLADEFTPDRAAKAAKAGEGGPTPRQRRADAAILMSARSVSHAGKDTANRYRVQVIVDARLLADGPVEFDGAEPLERPCIRGRGPIPRAVARRLAANAGYTLIAVDELDDPVATSRRAAPFSKRQLDALLTRDRRCQLPGCGATRHLAGHHVVHREHGGLSSLDNGACVCGSCHRLLHEGGFRLERVGPQGADLGPVAAGLPSDVHDRARARRKAARVQRFRLYGADGTEYGSIGAARQSLMAATLPQGSVAAAVA